MTTERVISYVLAAHELHASMNVCLCRNWRAVADAGSLAGQHRAHVAAEIAKALAPEVPVDAAGREALAELALLYGRFIIGRWAEVMASDVEPADDWQERAAREAVDLFSPAAERFMRAVRAAALEEAADDLEMKRGMGGSAFQWDHGLLSIASTTRTLRNRAAAYREGGES